MINLEFERHQKDKVWKSGVMQFNTFVSLERWFKGKCSTYKLVDNPMGMRYRIKASARNMSTILKIKNESKVELFWFPRQMPFFAHPLTSGKVWIS